MNDPWRVVGITSNDAFMNMAIDQAVCMLCSRGRVPNTIRLYRWHPSAVSIGYFQRLQDEVNVERCRELGIDLVRRLTGGGAVYHDSNAELTYSLIADKADPSIPLDIEESYRRICECVVRALGLLGMNATFRSVNDIEVGGRKISGNAQTRRWGSVLQHGTVLMDADLKTMFSVLTISREKISDKMIQRGEERITTIKRELGSDVGFEELAQALCRGFKSVLGIKLESGEISGEEVALAQRLREEKYATKEWTFSRPRQSLEGSK